MPRLPSGHCVALDLVPIVDLELAAWEEHDPARLLFLDRPCDLYPMITVHEVEHVSGIPVEELEVIETAEGEQHCITRPTGLTVEDVLGARASWSRGDIEALRRFVENPRMRSAIQERLDSLSWSRDQLTRFAVTEPRLEAILPREV